MVSELKLNGDKQWLEQLLNEKFKMIEVKLDHINEKVKNHEDSISKIDSQHEDCRNEVMAKIEHLLGKEEGMNLIVKKRRETVEHNVKIWGFGITILNIIIQIVFWVGRNLYFAGK